MRPFLRLGPLASAASLALGLGAAACTGESAAVCTTCEAVDTIGFDIALAGDVTLLGGSVGEVEVTVTRTGVPGAVVVSAQGLPANVSASTLTIPSGETKGKLALTALPAALHGRHTITIVGADVEAKVRRERPTSLLVRGAPGALDTSYGTGGRAEAAFGGASVALAGIAVQPDGSVLAAGSAKSDFVVGRFDANGKLDEAYGASGYAVVNHRAEEGTDELARALALAPGGKPVVGGYAVAAAPPNEYQVSRLDAAGRADATFDGDGTWAKPHPTAGWNAEVGAHALAVQDDGKVLVAGFATENRLGFVRHAIAARLAESGALDASFGGTGFIDAQATVNVDIASTSADTCNAVAVAPGGRVVCAGVTELTPAGGGMPSKHVLVWRALPDGRRDGDFGANGLSLVAYAPNGVDGEARSVHPLPDGSLLVTGERSQGVKAFALRLDPTGRPDAAFGGTGIVELAPGGGFAGHTRSAADASGRLVLVGTSGPDFDLALARIDASGKLDAAFGDAGSALVKLGTRGTVNNARVAFAPDGRVYVATSLDGKGVVVFRLWQ